MKNLQKRITMIIILVILSISLIGCDNDAVKKETAIWAQDTGTMWEDSGLDSVACNVDNVLVGNNMTGQDYCK